MHVVCISCGKETHKGKDIPPSRSLSSTMLKLRRQMGQLLARSTHGFRQLLCRIWPQGSNWVIWPASSLPSTPFASIGESLGLPSARRSGLGAASAVTARGSLALSPRSPKHTIQVSDINSWGCARIVCREAKRRHEEQLAKRDEKTEAWEEEGKGREEARRSDVGRKQPAF